MKMSHIDEGTLHSYLDGEVSERQRTEIAGHLATCEECRTRLEAAEALSGRAAELLAELEPGTVQPPSWREIEERAAARRHAAPRPVRLRPRLAWAASIALAFAVGWASQAYFVRMPASEVGVVGALEADRSQAPQLRQRGAVEPGEAQPEAARQEQLRASEPDMTAIQPRAKVTPEEEAATEVAGRAPEGAPAQRLRDQPAELAEQDRAAEPADELVVVEAPAIVAGIEVAREEAQPQAAVPVDRAAPQPAAHAFEAERALAERRDAEAKSTGFVELPATDAALWLGKEPRTLPELTLERVEVGPGAALEGAQPGLPAIRLVYEDAAGNEIILTQQWLGGGFDAFAETAPAMTVEPSGHRAYRWLDDQGYLLILEGNVSGDSLRALAERLR
ncbi:MAG: zf-HC2 domain-containing protein [Gemmatimonadota bacterium]|nr:MAG: zf-HC2 domain-containing protein [Gemmatimonadota bacterium]